MNVGELIAALIQLKADGSEPVRIDCFAGMRTGINVKSVRLGIDHNTGAIMIVPEHQLEVYQSMADRKRREQRKKAMLDEIMSKPPIDDDDWQDRCLHAGMQG